MTLLECFRLFIDVIELGIAIGMSGTFARLTVRLQTIMHSMQPVSNRARTDHMPHGL
jgi:hypothetical protein